MPGNRNHDAHHGRQLLGNHLHNLRIGLLSLVFLPGCLLGWKGYDKPTTDGSDCSQSADSADAANDTDTGDSTVDTVDTAVDPCDVTACERRLRDAGSGTDVSPKSG